MTEVVVVGGGPAGCAAATLLTRWGHEVTLVTKPAPETLPLGESIPPSTRKLFDLLGVRDRIDAAGFVRATGNTVWWGSNAPRIEYFANGERGWQVTTSALEGVLREAAMDAGVRTQIARVDPVDATYNRSSLVLDCSGRAGLYAQARNVRVGEAHRTIAMVGLWGSGGFDIADPSHTLIESYEGGWSWSVPTHRAQDDTSTHRFVAVMVDPRTSTLARRSASHQVYLAEIAKTRAIRALLERATLIDGPRGWDASMYHAKRYVIDNVLLVGDAGSFIDPLSSAGIKKALASGWLAAVAAHTSLIRPHLSEVALNFFDAREREVYDAFRAMTETYWRDAAASHAHPFWADRGAEPHVSSVDTDALSAAFERVRTAPELRLCANPATRVEARPAVSGTEIVLEQRLVRADEQVGTRYAYDVDLLGLVALAPLHASVPTLFEAYNRAHPPVALPDFLGALATVIAQHWLLWCDKN